MAALLEAKSIFAKGVTRIYFNLAENYYKALFRLPALGLLDARDADVPRSSSAHWAEFVKSGKLPGLAPAGGLADVMAAIEEGALPADYGVLHAVEDEFPPMVLQKPDGGPHRVLFDNCSSGSGIRRAYIKCPSHEESFRYGHINTAPTLQLL